MKVHATRKKAVSIIILLRNNKTDLHGLIGSITASAKLQKLRYEIIFALSNPEAIEEINISLKALYPSLSENNKNPDISVVPLQKAYTDAKYDYLCVLAPTMIHSLNGLPVMLNKIVTGHADIVIGQKRKDNQGRIGKLIHSLFTTIFIKGLHGVSEDIDSGFKLFRKEIIERLPMSQLSEYSDLEFILKTKNAGYKITTYVLPNTGAPQLTQHPRYSHIGISALRLKMQRPDIVPFHPNTIRQKGRGFHYKGQEFIHHSNLAHSQTAFHRLSLMQIKVIFWISIGGIFCLYLNWHITLVIIFSLLTILYFVDLLFNLYLIYRSFSRPVEIVIRKGELNAIADSDWPSYTVLCPLYKEWQVLPQFITAMSKLDYPKEKLQVMLLLEEDDMETIDNVKKYNLPYYFTSVIVPHSLPKTKPKACNYGLLQATGDYTVIYDAEDVPDPLQLKKAVLAFGKAGSQTVCIQAKLNFYNPNQNLLTKVFTAEYSLWFDLVLTGLQSIKAPIPLGGTSNHFKTADLQKLRGWDSFNVTEDADLGMRLVKQGFNTAVVDSITLEEANSGMTNWFGQRTRWIKGYMQTYLLHMRNPKEFIQKWRQPHAVTFQLVVGGKVLSMFINPLMWATTILYFVYRAHIGSFIESFFPTPILYIGVTSLLFGNFLYMYYYMIGCKKHGHHELVKYAFIVPFYWLAMSCAAWVAFYKFITDPHYWHKTKHGLHLNKNTVIDQLQDSSTKALIDRKITSPARGRSRISGISIVLPAYNEAENISPMIKKVVTCMEELKLNYEIIVVNDGSRDNTKSIINTLISHNKRIRAIHHKTNYGYGAALRSGFSAANKDWIFFTDSDMQFDITEITKLLDKAPVAHLVIGYRKNRQDPFIRVLNANLYKAALRLLFGLSVRDVDCAFKLFSREIIVKNPLKSNGALINAELLVKVKRKKYKTEQVSVTHYPRIKGSATGANPKVILQAMKELITFRFANTL